MAKVAAEQMELFEPVTRGFDDGGLMDEGGTVDPVSGNDVPPGSTQEEVRDDIPAQLSEGEFVILTTPKYRDPFRNRCNTQPTAIK